MPRKVSILSKLFALVLSLLLLPMVGASPSPAIAAAPVQSVELFQTPAEVFGYQPVFILARPSTPAAQVSLRTTVEFVLASDSLALTLLGISSPGEVTLASPMLPIPWAKGWYMTAIPPLPAATRTFTVIKPGIPQTQTEVTLSVSTDVSYEVLVDGVAQAQGDYQVKQGTPARELAPVVYAMPSAILEGTDFVEETLGLGPEGWVWEGGQSFPALVMAFDDKGLEGLTSLKFEYQVMDGPWSTAALSESPLQKAIREGVDAINEATELIESGVRTYSDGFTMERAFVPLFIGQAEIPAQSAGAYVRFRGTAEDVDGNSSISPAGLYYTVNTASDTRVLIIDPHVRNRAAQEALKEVAETVERNNRYGLPQEVAAGLEPLKQAGELAKKYGLTPFHHWELLGKTYDLHIVSPAGEPDRLLETFAPRVIVLSNLYLGLEDGGYLGWDLRDLGVLDKLIDYVKTNHAGVVATHGTLSDWKVWLGAEEEERVKVGARGHVGEKIPDDLDILDEKTIAGLLGMPHLAIFELARDAVAESLLADAPTYAVGLAVGSMPLQVPFVPFDGELESTPEGKGHPLLVGLGDPFLISSSGPHEELGFEASTEVGWQLAMPQALALTAWKAAQEAKPHVQKTGEQIAGLASEVLEGAVPATEAARVEEAVDWGLDRIYSSIVGARILPTAFRISVDVPGVGKRDEVVSLAYEELMGLVPIKLVALSNRGLAGIVAHDKFYVEDGYRAVYISVEPEAGSGTTNAQLLANAIDWAKRWEYKDLLGLLGERVRAAKETVSAFQSEAARLKGEALITDDLLLNERGHATLDLDAKGPGSFSLLIAHPTSPTVSVEVLEGDAVLAGISDVGPGVSLAEITVMQAGILSIGLTAASDFSLNPAHVQATYAEEAEPTATPTTTRTATAVITLTPTPSATPTATPVSADGSATPTPSPTLTPTVTPTRAPTSAPSPEQSATATLTPNRTVVGPPPPAPIATVTRSPVVAALQPTVAKTPTAAAPIQPTPTATLAPVPEGGGAGCSLPGRSGSSGLDVGLLLLGGILGGILLRLKVRQPKP